MKAEEVQRHEKTLSQAAVAQAIEGNHRKTTSRLTPYMSEAVRGNDAASSAVLRATKAPNPKNSLHAVPPSTYQPEFRYRYSRKGMSTATSPQSAPFVDAPELLQASWSSITGIRPQFSQDSSSDVLDLRRQILCGGGLYRNELRSKPGRTRLQL